MKSPGAKLSNLFKMLATVTVFGLAAIYSVIAFSARDPVWFQRGFEARPVRVVIYHAGQTTELRAGDAGFAPLAEAVRACLDQGIVSQSGIGLGEETLKDAYAKYTTLEAFFDVPAKLHAWFNTGAPTQMLFLVTGRHSETPMVFLGENGVYLVNAPVLKTLQPIRDVLNSMGYDTTG